MKLDFTGLSNLTDEAKNEPIDDLKSDNHIIAPKTNKKPLELNTESHRHIEEDKNKRYLKIERDLQIREESQRIHKLLQENVRKSERIRAEISKDIARGESPSLILLKALDVIALMTGDKLFSKQNIESFISSQIEQGNKDVINHRIQRVTEKMVRLKESLKIETDSKQVQRISNVIAEYDIELENLKGALKKDDKK